MVNDLGTMLKQLLLLLTVLLIARLSVSAGPNFAADAWVELTPSGPAIEVTPVKEGGSSYSLGRGRGEAASDPLLGSWGSGFGTEDYPSSYSCFTNMTFKADGTFTLSVTEEHLVSREPLKYSTHVSEQQSGRWSRAGRNRYAISYQD